MASALQLACACASISLGCASSGFACHDDPQCGEGGTCEPEGWCSFPDDACTSGRRFGEHAGGGLASRCVPTRPDTSTGPVDPSVASSVQGSSGTPAGTTVVAESTGAIESSAGPSDDEGTADGSSTGVPGDPDLLVWLAFDDLAAPFADASGNGNHGQCDGAQCPASAPGVLGDALRFDGVDDRLALPAEGELAGFTALTIALWVDVEALELDVYQDVVAKTLGEASNNSFGIGFPNTTSSLRVVMNDGVELVEVGALVWPDDGWHHVAMTWDGALARLYFDGAVTGEAAIAALGSDEHPVLIGADINARTEGNYFGGMLDDVRIYRRALAEDEVVALVDG